MTRLLWLLVLVCACAPVARADAARCRVRHPDPAAFVARSEAARRAWTPEQPGLRRLAAVRSETQLDVVDILVAYDLSAVRWLSAKGKGTPFAYARASVEKMNASLALSRLSSHFRLRLAGVVQVYADFSSASHTMDDILDSFIDDRGNIVAKGYLRKVADRREECGADIVSLLVARGNVGLVGLGYSLDNTSGILFSRNSGQIASFGDWAYHVCSIQAVDEDYTQLHEVGHNMGAGHPDRSCAIAQLLDLGPQLYAYSAGYYLWLNGVGYHTVMGYNYGGRHPDGSSSVHERFQPLPYFSSPELIWNGRPLGTAVNDNRRTLLETCRWVAQYRESRLPPGANCVDEAENARSEAAWKASSGDIVVAGYMVSGGFMPTKAVNGQSPYVGGVYSNDVPVGVISLKIGKASAAGGVAKVAGTVTLVDGRSFVLAAARVRADAEPVLAPDLQVKKLGTLDLWLGSNGFAGRIVDTPWGTLDVHTANFANARTAGAAEFCLEATQEELSAALGKAVRGECLPLAEPITVLRNGKWTCRKAAMVKYVLAEDGTWKLLGAEGTEKCPSGLKLTCTPKKSTFKGKFMVYSTSGSAARPRLQKTSAAVTGVVIGGEGRGRATVKGVGSWPVHVK